MKSYQTKLTILMSIVVAMVLGIGLYGVTGWFGYISNITVAWILTSLSLIPVLIILLNLGEYDRPYISEIHPLFFLSAIMISTTSLAIIRSTTDPGGYPILFSTSILSFIFSLIFFINNAHEEFSRREAIEA